MNWSGLEEPMLRKLNQVLVPTGITLLTLIVLDAVLPGFKVRDVRSAFFGILALTLINAAILPLAVKLTLPLNLLSLGLLPLVLNGLAVLLVSWFIPGFAVRDVLTGILVSFGLLFNSMLITSSYVFRGHYGRLEYSTLAALAGKRAAEKEDTTPGIIMLEIDGLSEPILRRAIEAGLMPTLAGWLKNGTHCLAQWETSLPSQTSSMQAGILHGSHYNIPAFRFYDRLGKVMLVSNRPQNAEKMIQPVLNGQGLLRERGFSVSNWATGDAPEIVLTFAAPRQGVFKQSSQLSTYFSRAYTVQRVLVGMAWDVVVEVTEGLLQSIQNVQPRIARRFPYPLVRAATTRLLPYLNCQLIVTKMFEHIQAVYTTFLSYDEVAHHSGIDRPDVQRILPQLDDQISFISGAARFTSRPYEFIILSDHGQSMGATFRQRYGMTLAELVDKLVGQDQPSFQAPGSSAEGIDYVSLMLSELVEPQKERPALLNRLLRKRISEEGYVELRERPNNVRTVESANAPKTMVCVSGNLAHIYFMDHEQSLTLDEIDAAFPKLTEGLSAHDGIAFIVARTDKRGPLVIGKQGIYFLETGQIQGENPLRDFGDHAPDHLKELISYPNSGDIVVNSLYDPKTGEVAAFEELVGSHGGLGGTQNQPFILYPSTLQPENPGELVGAPAIYHLVQTWQEKVRDPAYRPTVLPGPTPHHKSGEQLRSITLVANTVMVAGIVALLLGSVGLIMALGHQGTFPRNVNEFLVMLLTAPFLLVVGNGLRRSQQWALNFAIAINALIIILSVTDVMAEPPDTRASLRGLPLVLVIYAALFAYLLYSNRIRRAFG